MAALYPNDPNRPSVMLRAYLSTGALDPRIAEWAGMVDRMDARKVLSLPRGDRVPALSTLPEGRRERVEAECKRLYQQRRDIAKES